MITYVGISALGCFFFVLRCRCIKNVLLKLGNVLLIKYIFKICSVSVLLFRLQKYVLLLHFFFHLIFNLLVFQYSCGIQVCEYLLMLKRFTGVDRPKQTEFFALKHFYSIFQYFYVLLCTCKVKYKCTFQLSSHDKTVSPFSTDLLNITRLKDIFSCESDMFD